MKTNKTLISCAVAGALSASAAGALASGFQLMEQNASGLGNAYSGQAAAAENASTIFFNPAGMTRLPGRQVVGALNAIGPSTKFTNSGTSAAPLGIASPGGNGGDAGDWAFVPNAYLSWQVNPQWWVGVGMSVPFGLKTEYDQGWVGRFQGQRSEIKTVDINPSVAFKVSDAVSLGFGVSYQMGKVKIDRSAILIPPVESFAKIRVEDEQWGWNIGAMFNLGPNTRIGLSYRSTIDYSLTGSVTFTGVPLVGTAAQNVRVDAEVPDTFSWGIAHQLNPKWELLGDITYTRWSRIKALPLVTTSASPLIGAGVTLDTFNFQFRDTYRIGIGANWKWRDDFTAKVGVAYDRSPVTDPFRTVTLPDNDRTWIAIGGKYRMSKQATLDFGYAHLFIKDSPINQLRGLAALPLQGNVVGNYEADVNIVSVQFSYSF